MRAKRTMIVEVLNWGRKVKDGAGNTKTITFPKGLMVGTHYQGKVRFGLSLVNLGAGDKFDMKEGIIRALRNMLDGKGVPDLPNPRFHAYVQERFLNFKVHCEQEFGAHETRNDQVDSRIFELVRSQLNGKGINDDEIRDFLSVALPFANKLQAMGCMGFALPPGMGMGGGMVGALDVSQVGNMLSMMGGMPDMKDIMTQMGFGSPAPTPSSTPHGDEIATLEKTLPRVHTHDPRNGKYNLRDEMTGRFYKTNPDDDNYDNHLP